MIILQVHSLSRASTCTDSQSPERVAYLWTTVAAARDAPPTKMIIIMKQNKKYAEALLLAADVLRVGTDERRTYIVNTYNTCSILFCIIVNTRTLLLIIVQLLLLLFSIIINQAREKSPAVRVRAPRDVAPRAAAIQPYFCTNFVI